MRARVARALLYQGIAREQAGEPDRAVELYSQVVQRFGDVPNVVGTEDLGWELAVALLRRGWILERAGEHGDALESFRQVVSRFREAGPAMRVARIDPATTLRDE